MSKLPECIKCGNYISHGNVICQDCLPQHDAQVAKAERERVDNLLNSRIAKIEIINSKKPTQFREGALMAYRDIEESLRAQQQG
jgi:hypothetical protein